MDVKKLDEINKFILDLKGKQVYVELINARKYKGKLDGVNTFHCRIIKGNGLPVVFPIEKIINIEEEY